MNKLLASVSLLLLASAAEAACPNPVPANVACVRWTASPGWTNNVPYDPSRETVTYSVHLIESGASVRVVASGVVGVDATIRGLPAGIRCFAVVTNVRNHATSIVANSGLSNVACKTLRFPGPTDGSIEAPTDGSIEQPRR